MPVTYSGASGAVATLNRALQNTSNAKTVFDAQVAAATAALPSGADAAVMSNYAAYADTLAASLPAKTSAQWSNAILTNMGILPSTVAAVQALEGALTAYIDANGGVARIGTIALQLGNLIGTLETATGAQAVYNAAAVAWNTEVSNSVSYSSNAASTASTTDNVASPVANLTLTTSSSDNLAGTSGVDNFKGVNSAAIADGTLQASDVVNGDAGEDSIAIDMHQNWTGFTTGSVKNVETLSLTSKTTAATTWSNVGTTGVTKFVIDSTKAIVNVTNIDTLAAIEITGPTGITADTTFTAGYTAASTVSTGTQTDTQVLKLKDVGTINTSTSSTSNAKFVAIDIDKVEAFTITTEGTANSFDLSAAADAKAVTVSGAGTTEIKAVSTATTSFDASAATGKVTVDLQNAAAGVLSSVKSGTADDSVVVDLADLTATATLAGGTGTDVLVAAAATGGKTLQANMSGFESIYFAAPAAVTGGVVFSGTNVTDVTSAKVNAGALGGAVSFVNMGTKDFTINTVGALTGNSVSTDNTGATTVNMSKTSTASASEVATTAINTAGVTTVNIGEYVQAKNVITSTTTGAVTLNVASKVVDSAELSGFIAATAGTDGKLVADTASSVTVAAAGALTNADIQAAKATTVSITAGSTGAATIHQLNAPKATTLNLTGGSKGLDMESATGATDLSKVQTVTATNSGTLDFTGVDLSAFGTGTFTGAASTSALTLAAVGASTQTYNLSLTASGQKAGMTTGAVNAGTGAVTVDISAVTGNVTMTTINGDGGVTLNAKNLGGTFSNGTTNAISAAAGNISIDVSNASKSVGISSDGTTISTIFASSASGASGTLGGDVTVLATNAIAGANIGTLTGKNVTVEATNALAAVKVGNGSTAGADIFASTSVTYKGANLSSLTNHADIQATDGSTALAVNLTGGAAVDTFTVTGGAKQTSITVAGDVGSGTQSLTVTLANQTTASTAQSVDLSGYKGSSNTSTTTTTNLTAEVDGAITYKGSAMNDKVQILVNGTAFTNSAALSITDTTTTDSDTLEIGKAGGGTAKAVTLTQLSLSGIEKMTVTATQADADNTVSINASAVSGKAMDISGSTTSQKLTLTGTAGADVIDLSNITTDGTNFIGLSISGSTGNDAIVLATATGGAKILDTIVFGTAATNGADTITGFTKGGTNSDVLKLDGLATLVGTGGTGGVAATNAVYVGATAAGTKGNTAVSKVVAIGDAASSDWANVVTQIGGALTVAGDTTAGNAATVVLISNGTDTRVYLFSDDATNNTTVESTELTLVGTLSGVTSTTGFVEGNFLLA